MVGRKERKKVRKEIKEEEKGGRQKRKIKMKPPQAMGSCVVHILINMAIAAYEARQCTHRELCTEKGPRQTFLGCIHVDNKGIDVHP